MANKNKILLICKCGKWKIVDKADHDPKEAIYTYQWCEKCVDSGYDVNEGYFVDNGKIVRRKLSK
jgi:hypothetical protein